MMCHQCVSYSPGHQIEKKHTVLRVFKMVATAIKKEELSSGCGCFFHHSHSIPAIAVTYAYPVVECHV